MKINSKTFLLLMVFTYLLLAVLFVLFFKNVRNYFSFTPIPSDGIVGYAHYYGYPLVLDTLIFFIFLLSPVVLLIIVKIINKK